MHHAARLASVLLILAMGSLTGCAAKPAASRAPSATADPAPAAPSADAQFEELEAKFDARLGVYALDTGTDLALEYRGEERFAYASTIKVLATAVLLDQSTDAELDTVVTYDESDLLEYAPITEQHVDTGMTLRELGDAAIRYSDNTAANLIFDQIGGPAGLAGALQAMGDDVTQVDREEPELNEATPGDPRDTSTPKALATNLDALIFGDTLEASDRETLTAWLEGNTTGDELIRAGVPAEWRVGDKTGSAGFGTRNDIAVIWPADGDPIVLAVMSTRSEPDADYDNALIAEATAVAIEALGR